MPAIERLTTRFYERVCKDPLIGPVFAHMHGDHPRFVVQFIAEVFGSPAKYSAEQGAHPHEQEASAPSRLRIGVADFGACWNARVKLKRLYLKIKA